MTCHESCPAAISARTSTAPNSTHKLQESTIHQLPSPPAYLAAMAWLARTAALAPSGSSRSALRASATARSTSRGSPGSDQNGTNEAPGTSSR